MKFLQAEKVLTVLLLVASGGGGVSGEQQQNEGNTGDRSLWFMNKEHLGDNKEAYASFYSGSNYKAEQQPKAKAEEDDEFWDTMMRSSVSFTEEPSTSPSASPSVPPTPPPTGVCDIELTLDCTVNDDDNDDSNNDPCSDLRGEEDLQCGCPDCVREITFTYTGNACDSPNGVENSDSFVCADEGTGPTAMSRLMIANAADEGDVLFSGTVQPGMEVVLSRSDPTACLPQSLVVFVLPLDVTPNPQVLQMMTIDSSCEARGLFLKASYGALDFVGYHCDMDDTHDCFIDVTYGIDACNIGDIDLAIEEFIFTFAEAVANTEEAPTNLLAGIPQDQLELVPGDCLEVVQERIFDRCNEREYCAGAEVEATSSGGTGPICEDDKEIKIFLFPGSIPPTMAPTIPPTVAPTIPPTVAPTIPPTVAPTLPPTIPPTVEPTQPPSIVPTLEPTIPPTVAPTIPPTVPPTLEPTVPPTIAPTIPPTTMPPIPCPLQLDLDPEALCDRDPFNVCSIRPWRMQFFYRGGFCNETMATGCQADQEASCVCTPAMDDENLKENKINCCDAFAQVGDVDCDVSEFTNGLPPGRVPGRRDDTTDPLETVWIVAREAGKDEIYFEGPVTVGQDFNAIEASMDRVSANMDLEVFRLDPATNTSTGQLLQRSTFHSSCSQELYLLDVYGGFQLIEFEFVNDCDENEIVTSRVAVPSFSLDLDFNVQGELVLDFAQIFLTDVDNPNPADIQVQELAVAGTSIPPAFVAETNFIINKNTEYRVRAVVSGTFNGRPCSGFDDDTFRCPRTCGLPDEDCERRELSDKALRGGDNSFIDAMHRP